MEYIGIYSSNTSMQYHFKGGAIKDYGKAKE
jgi:hypothetical protein